ncbi:MAG: acetyl-CoA carboxylase, biotin carboxyl carrier protein [Planctomycetaceae bacterium]|nr:acetyl-CoA carboxylase, biotin carboxyl carrier protein [Planctomycetaceae bacterium]
MADESQGGDVFDEERLCRLIELMKEHDLEEIDLQEEDQRICLRRNVGGGVTAGGYPPPGFAAPYPAPAPPPAPTLVAQSIAATTAASGDGDNITVITSPMVGTFYTKPNPNSPTYVKVGDHVDPEKTICIIEAMKVFSEIPAEISGRIVAVLVQNEEPIEFGTPLFKVDTQA